MSMYKNVPVRLRYEREASDSEDMSDVETSSKGGVEIPEPDFLDDDIADMELQQSQNAQAAAVIVAAPAAAALNAGAAASKARHATNKTKKSVAWADQSTQSGATVETVNPAAASTRTQRRGKKPAAAVTAAEEHSASVAKPTHSRKSEAPVANKKRKADAITASEILVPAVASAATDAPVAVQSAPKRLRAKKSASVTPTHAAAAAVGLVTPPTSAPAPAPAPAQAAAAVLQQKTQKTQNSNPKKTPRVPKPASDAPADDAKSSLGTPSVAKPKKDGASARPSQAGAKQRRDHDAAILAQYYAGLVKKNASGNAAADSGLIMYERHDVLSENSHVKMIGANAIMRSLSVTPGGIGDKLTAPLQSVSSTEAKLGQEILPGIISLAKTGSVANAYAKTVAGAAVPKSTVTKRVQRVVKFWDKTREQRLEADTVLAEGGGHFMTFTFDPMEGCTRTTWDRNVGHKLLGPGGMTSTRMLQVLYSIQEHGGAVLGEGITADNAQGLSRDLSGALRARLEQQRGIDQGKTPSAKSRAKKDNTAAATPASVGVEDVRAVYNKYTVLQAMKNMLATSEIADLPVAQCLGYIFELYAVGFVDSDFKNVVDASCDNKFIQTPEGVETIESVNYVFKFGDDTDQEVAPAVKRRKTN